MDECIKHKFLLLVMEASQLKIEMVWIKTFPDCDIDKVKCKLYCHLLNKAQIHILKLIFLDSYFDKRVCVNKVLYCCKTWDMRQKV